MFCKKVNKCVKNARNAQKVSKNTNNCVKKKKHFVLQKSAQNVLKMQKCTKSVKNTRQLREKMFLFCRKVAQKALKMHNSASKTIKITNKYA